LEFPTIKATRLSVANYNTTLSSDSLETDTGSSNSLRSYRVNAFALRSTDPKALYIAVRDGQDPVGPENDRYILEVAARASLRVVGWGKHETLLTRGRRMAELLAGFDLY
jgi:hypothetical protein